MYMHRHTYIIKHMRTNQHWNRSTWMEVNEHGQRWTPAKAPKSPTMIETYWNHFERSGKLRCQNKSISDLFF